MFSYLHAAKHSEQYIVLFAFESIGLDLFN